MDSRFQPSASSRCSQRLLSLHRSVSSGAIAPDARTSRSDWAGQQATIGGAGAITEGLPGIRRRASRHIITLNLAIRSKQVTTLLSNPGCEKQSIGTNVTVSEQKSI